MDMIDKIMAYEEGMLDGAGMVYLFAELIKDGSGQCNFCLEKKKRSQRFIMSGRK